jgi:hypothetical protein
MAQISKQALIVENNQSFPNNNNGAITPSELRGFNVDMIDSTVNQTQYTTDSGSWNVSIGRLNAFTASQQPSFTALNSFTASQLVINSGVNTYTQSANARLTALESETANLETFTSSINQIRSNGIVLGTSTIFNLVGPGTFFSASIVQNIDGPIATLSFTSDNAKLNTSSFNDYTASTAATQSVFSASVATSISQSSAAFSAFSSSQNTFNQSATASISQLLSFSSSLDAGFVSEAEFGQFTQSINSYTASTNARLSSIENRTGSFATTGSNSFNGNQNITGSLILSSSNAVELQVIGNSLFTGSVTISGSALYDLDVIGGIRATGSAPTIFNTNGVNGEYFGSTFGGNIGVYDVAGLTEIGFALDGNEWTTNWANGPILYVNNTPGDTYEAAFGFQNKTNYTDGRITALKPLIAQQGAVISGSTTITGSVYGNVRAVTITSNTASIDLSVANYFTLTLSGSTNINVTNPRAGVTATLVINTSTGASASFSSNVKQPSGSFYAASPSGNIDIISFTAVNSTNVFAFPAQSFV